MSSFRTPAGYLLGGPASVLNDDMVDRSSG
jgi:hypothetical protein